MKEPLKKLLNSLKDNNYSYEVVGYGIPWKGFRNRVNTYLSAVTRYKEEAGGDSIIVILDGYDCLCIKDSNKVYNSFINRPRKDIPVMFGAEVVCMSNCNKDILKWHTHHNIYGGEDEIKKTIKIDNDVLLSDKSVFLNGGMLIARVGAIEEVYTGMLNLHIEDDQVCASTYTINNLNKVDLDIEEVIFRNKLLERRVKLDDENGDTGPGFLHFPGSDNKNTFNDVLDWFSPYT